MLRCEDCDEDLAVGAIYCLECGSMGVRVEPEPATSVTQHNSTNNGDNDRLESIFSILGTDLRAAIEASLQEQSMPARSIASNYLKRLGRLKLDSRKSLLRNVWLQIGPLRCNGVFAEFSPLMEDGDEIKLDRIVLADPISGNGMKNKDNFRLGGVDVDADADADANISSSSPSSSSSPYHSTLIMERGVISFANKAINAQKAGASVLIIAQTFDKFPFQPQDSAKELETKYKDTVLQIPVFCISLSDYNLLKRLLHETCFFKTHTDRHDHDGNDYSSERLLKCTKGDETCPICFDELAVADEVFKLPCCHFYHADCLTRWLQTQNTCPLCRSDMPQQRDEMKAEDVTRRQSYQAAFY